MAERPGLEDAYTAAKRNSLKRLKLFGAEIPFDEAVITTNAHLDLFGIGDFLDLVPVGSKKGASG